MSRMLANRSVFFFASAVFTTWSIAAGTRGFSALGTGISSDMCIISTSPHPGEMYGARPHNISYRMQPSA